LLLCAAGVCTAINFDVVTSQCYLYAHVTAHKPAGNSSGSTWKSYDQQLQPGSAASCHDTAGLVSAWESDVSMTAMEQVGNAYILRRFIPKLIILPRQARDKHRGRSTQKER
jgi:hypothetical protein